MTYTFPVQNIDDLHKFLELVKQCENDVGFESSEGDKLSLHSALCQYILYSLMQQKHLTENAVIRVEGSHDREILHSYFK